MSHEHAEPTSTDKTPGVPNGAEADNPPAAGPHAKPELTDNEKTPGAGALSDTDETDVGDGASS